MAKLNVILIIEILGRPADHVKEALNTLVVKLGSEKGVTIINKTYHDPTPVKDSQNLFTAFAELELELDSIENYLGIIFAYMPSHIEIIHPEKFQFTNTELNDLGNKLIERLHNYDAVVKNVLAEREELLTKLKEVAPQFFMQQPQQKKEEELKKDKKKSR